MRGKERERETVRLGRACSLPWPQCLAHSRCILCNWLLHSNQMVWFDPLNKYSQE
jgi:hypothetical protein